MKWRNGGVIDVIDPTVETPEVVCERVLTAARYIPYQQLGTTDDCGFSPFGDDGSTARETAFGMIAAGGVGSWWAGALADRFGRTTLTIAALAISGICALTVGFLFGGKPWLVAFICLVWGFAVVADSAQFSAALSELSRPAYVGTALTLQTSFGFLLTLVSIRLVPWIEPWVGWSGAFALLALGPLLGILAMAALRVSPAVAHLAGGRG